MINQFLEISSHILSQNGGEVTKFIGDSVLAYFDPSQADVAVKTSLEILAEIEKIRHAPSPNNLLPLLYCGIGLSKGEVIEGNFGSSVKTDYTIMGDPESLILSAEVKHSLQQDWPIVKLGSFALKGKKMQVEAFTLDDPLVDQWISHEQIVNELSQI
jgi:class 3 adenylate cyclase